MRNLGIARLVGAHQSHSRAAKERHHSVKKKENGEGKKNAYLGDGAPFGQARSPSGLGIQGRFSQSSFHSCKSPSGEQKRCRRWLYSRSCQCRGLFRSARSRSVAAGSRLTDSPPHGSLRHYFWNCSMPARSSPRIWPSARPRGPSRVHPAEFSCPPPPSFSAIAATFTLPLARRLSRTVPSFNSRANTAASIPAIPIATFTMPSVSSSFAPALAISSSVIHSQAISPSQLSVFSAAVIIFTFESGVEK